MVMGVRTSLHTSSSEVLIALGRGLIVSVGFWRCAALSNSLCASINGVPKFSAIFTLILFKLVDW